MSVSTCLCAKHIIPLKLSQMKISLPLQLRRALLSLCMLCTTATVAYAEDVERTQITDSTTAANTLFNGTAEYVTMNFTGDKSDFFPQSSPTSLDDILVIEWTVGDGHKNQSYTFEGKIHGTGNIRGWNSGTTDDGHTYIFNGDMSEFSGNITSGSRGLVLKFGGDARSAISGTGAISITHLNKGVTYEVGAGNSTITNSSITTNTLNFNGGAGVNYSVDSTISVSTLLNIAADTSVTLNANTTTQGLTVGSGASLTLNANTTAQGLTIDSGASLSVGSGASLTINGALSLFSSITNGGSVIFGDSATVDLSNLTFSTSDQTSTYSLVSGGSIDFGDLDWTSFTGVHGLSATSHDISFDTTAGTVSFTLLAKQLSFAGSVSSESPTILNWNTLGDTIFDEGGSAAAFENGAGVTFTGHTVATLEEDIDVYKLTIAEDSSLSIDESGFSFSAGSVELQNDSSLTLASTLDSGEANFDAIYGGSSASLIILASTEGTTLSLANFTGTLNVQAGHAMTSFADFDRLDAVRIDAGAHYSITDTLANGAADLTKVSGASDSILTIKGVGNLSDSGANSGEKTNLDLSANFNGILEIAGGLVGLTNSDFGDTSSLILSNGGIIGDHAAYTTSTFDKDIEISSGTTGYGRVYGSERALDLTGAISGDSTTTLAQTDGGILKLSGDMSAFQGTIAVRGGKVIANSGIESAKSVFISEVNSEFFPTGAIFEVAADVIVNTLGDYNSENGSYTSYQRRTSYDYTITVQAGAEFNDNVHLRQASGSLTVNGGGYYQIESYVGGDLTGASTLTIAANTTMEVMGTTENYAAAGRLPAFSLTHNQNGTVDVNGTLILNSGISKQDATGTLNVNAGGTLVLKEGLYGNAKNGQINLNVADTATLKLSNQTQESTIYSGSNGNINTNIAAGATITATSDFTDILNTLSLSGTGSVKVNAEAGVYSVDFKDVISNTSGASSGLAITGQSANQKFTLSAANTYTGDTSITTASVEAGNAAAFGNGGTVTLNSGSLNLSGLGVANDVVAVSGSLSGFDTFAGNLQVTGAVGISGRTTGSMSVTATGVFTMEGTWEYSSSIDIAAGGSLSFGSGLQLDLTDVDFSQSGNEYSLTLFTGDGSADINSWLNAGAVNLDRITGLDSSITSLSYTNGVLSYTVIGDIHISDTDQPLSGETNVNIIFDEGSTGKAELATGFTQGADSSFSGAGTIQIAAGANVTLNNASTDFSGTTEVGGTLTINNGDALGSSSVDAAANSQLIVSEGVTMSNNATLAADATLDMGVITITGQSESSSIGDEGASNKSLTHDSATQSSIRNAALTDTRVELASNGTGIISYSTLTNTHVQLGNGSTLTLTNVHQDLGTTLNNDSATAILTDHKITENVGTGAIVDNLPTLEGGSESMRVYTLTSLNVETTIINDSLTLTLIVMDGAEFSAQLTGGMIAFEISGFTLADGSNDQFNLEYTDVSITVLDGVGGPSLYMGTAQGTTTMLNGNMALYIPEPSTASLSLLALVGLLARRRRKQA